MLLVFEPESAVDGPCDLATNKRGLPLIFAVDVPAGGSSFFDVPIRNTDVYETCRDSLEVEVKARPRASEALVRVGLDESTFNSIIADQMKSNRAMFFLRRHAGIGGKNVADILLAPELAQKVFDWTLVCGDTVYEVKLLGRDRIGPFLHYSLALPKSPKPLIGCEIRGDASEEAVSVEITPALVTESVYAGTE